MNKELREDLEHLIICKDKSITPDLRDDVKMTLDYIDELEKENINIKLQLLENKISLKDVEYQEKTKLQQRIDKAIEYIEEHKRNVYDTFGEGIVFGEMDGIKELLNILRGEDNE